MLEGMLDGSVVGNELGVVEGDKLSDGACVSVGVSLGEGEGAGDSVGAGLIVRKSPTGVGMPYAKIVLWSNATRDTTTILFIIIECILNLSVL